MATYTDEVVAELAVGYGELSTKVEDMMLAVTGRQYRTTDGHNHAVQGFMRRATLLQHCIRRVFQFLPPETDQIPEPSVRRDVLVSLQAFSMNTFGCLDNLAWLWCSENQIEIKKSHVGLGPKNTKVRLSLPNEMRVYLEGLESWFEHLYELRHDLAHRIPFFIPPYIVDTSSIEAYREIEARKVAASSANDFDLYWRLDAEQDRLGKFKAVIAQGPIKSRLYYFHPNMLADFATIYEISKHLLNALDAVNAQSRPRA